MTQPNMDSFPELVSRFLQKRVLVVGDAILDEYLSGDCSRISPEAPVPVLRVSGSRRVLGGAANTAANVVSLGGSATLIALVGNDEGGSTLSRCAVDAGVELLAVNHDLPTLRKTRVVGQHQQIVRLDYENIQPPTPAVETEAMRLFEMRVDSCDIVVISDYAKGLVSHRLVQSIIERAHRAGRAVVIDPRPQHREYYKGCDYLTPNWRESRALLGWPDAEPTEESVSAVGHALGSELGTNVVLTLGAHGIAFFARDGKEQFALRTMAREVFDVSGAGDTVVAAFGSGVGL